MACGGGYTGPKPRKIQNIVRGWGIKTAASGPKFGPFRDYKEECMKGFLTFFLTITATVLLTFAFSAAARPTSAAAAALPAPHPHIHEALEHMRAGKHELETAEHDFHGHRAKSIEHLDQAIHEAEICEQEP
jgi:hypothetical protein